MTKKQSEPTVWVCQCGNRITVNVRLTEALCNKHVGGPRKMVILSDKPEKEATT